MSKPKRKVWAISLMPLPEPIRKDYTFTELMDEYQDSVFRGLYRLTKSKQDAEDLSQESFLKVLTMWDNIDFSTVRSLISIVAASLFLKWKNSKDKMIEIRSDDDEDPFDIIDMKFEESRAIFKDPESIMVSNQLFEEASQKIGVLSDEDQKLLELMFYDGLSKKDVASALGITYDCARKRLQRIRGRLEGLEGMEDV